MKTVHARIDAERRTHETILALITDAVTAEVLGDAVRVPGFLAITT